MVATDLVHASFAPISIVTYCAPWVTAFCACAFSVVESAPVTESLYPVRVAGEPAAFSRCRWELTGSSAARGPAVRRASDEVAARHERLRDRVAECGHAGDGCGGERRGRCRGRSREGADDDEGADGEGGEGAAHRAGHAGHAAGHAHGENSLTTLCVERARHSTAGDGGRPGPVPPRDRSWRTTPAYRARQRSARGCPISRGHHDREGEPRDDGPEQRLREGGGFLSVDQPRLRRAVLLALPGDGRATLGEDVSRPVGLRPPRSPIRNTSFGSVGTIATGVSYSVPLRRPRRCTSAQSGNHRRPTGRRCERCSALHHPAGRAGGATGVSHGSSIRPFRWHGVVVLRRGRRRPAG